MILMPFLLPSHCCWSKGPLPSCSSSDCTLDLQLCLDSDAFPPLPPLADVYSDECTDDYLISSGLLVKGSGCRNWICKTCGKEDVKSKVVRHIQTKGAYLYDVRSGRERGVIKKQME